MAKAYLFGEIEVTDPATYEEYRSGCRRRLQRMGERTSFEALITNLLWSRAADKAFSAWSSWNFPVENV